MVIAISLSALHCTAYVCMLTNVFFVLVECDESRLGILPFFSLPPFCLFCNHCSLYLYFAKYSCTFRSSVGYFFWHDYLCFCKVGELLFKCRACCETHCGFSNYQLCTHVLLYVLGFIFCMVGKSRVPARK